MTRPAQHRFPFGTLDKLTGWSANRWATEAGVTSRTIVRWRNEGVPEKHADRLAVAAGFHPAEVWPEWIDRHVAELDRRDEERRRKARERMRRLYRTNPEYRARQIERRRAYYRQAGDYERARERRRYQARKATAA